jgi:hypothetical protein
MVGKIIFVFDHSESETIEHHHPHLQRRITPKVQGFGALGTLTIAMHFQTFLSSSSTLLPPLKFATRMQGVCTDEKGMYLVSWTSRLRRYVG